MFRLRVAATCLVATMCLAALENPAAAETAKPKNVLEWLFGGRKAPEQAPTSITPPQPARLTPAPRQAIDPKPKSTDSKSGKADARPSVRKGTAAKQAIDPVKQTAASGPYSGPFHGGGNNAYCVRSCDGFFFPINHEGAQGPDRYETACQTSCPGAATQVFFMKRGGDIKWSSNARGQGYMSLENALKYRKERDPACTCKDSQASWAAVLKPVEGMMKPGKTDVVIADDAQAVAAAPEQAIPDKATSAKTSALSGEAAASAMRAATFNDKVSQPGKFNRIDPQPTGTVAGEKPAETPRGDAKSGNVKSGDANAVDAKKGEPKKVETSKVDTKKSAAKSSDATKSDAKRSETGRPKLDTTPTGSIPSAPRAETKAKTASAPTAKIASAEPIRQPAKPGANLDKQKLTEAVSRLVTPYKRQQ